jgi:ABC-2 type transport system permease protein
MNSFSAWLKKEMLEGARSYRFLIIGAAMAFFAFLDPLMLKLLPFIMKAQTGVDMSALITASRDFAFESFLGDLYEIMGIIVCILLGGTLAKERKTRRFVIPFSKGTGFSGIVLSKILVYAAFLAFALSAAAIVSYLYAGIVFPGSAVDFSVPLGAALRYSLYYTVVVAAITFLSAISPSGITASLLAALTVFGLPAIASVVRADRYLPSYLAIGSQKIANAATANFLPSELSATAAIVVCFFGAVVAMRKTEL